MEAYNLGGEGDITGCFCWTADKRVYGGLQPGGEGTLMWDKTVERN